MKFLIMPIITLVIFSSVSYSMTDTEFRDIMGQLNDKIEYLQSNIAQLKQELYDKFAESEDFILTEQQKMMIAYAQELEEGLDPMSFAMPVITFILVIISLYCALLGTWWGRYYFFKRRESYYEELKKKQSKFNEQKKEIQQTATRPEGQLKVDPYTQMQRERQYSNMVQKQKQSQIKGIVVAISLIVVFILVFFLIIMPLM